MIVIYLQIRGFSLFRIVYLGISLTVLWEGMLWL